jgi:hypothetical protein
MTEPSHLLHRAALALLHDAPGEALALMKQALGVDPSLARVGDRAAAVRAALPELERLVRERSLAAVVRHHPEQPLAPPGLLDDLAELLRSCPEGEALFAAERCLHQLLTHAQPRYHRPALERFVAAFRRSV